MSDDDLVRHARITRDDLCGELPNGVGNTMDAMCDRIEALLADIEAKDAVLRAIKKACNYGVNSPDESLDLIFGIANAALTAPAQARP